MTEQGNDGASEARVRTEQNEQEEAEDGWWQHERQRGQRLEHGKPSASAEHQQRGQRDGDGQQDGGGDGCKSKSESERLPVHGYCIRLTNRIDAIRIFRSELIVLGRLIVQPSLWMRKGST